MPPIPFEPEPLSSLQARYPDAIAFVYDGDAIRERHAIRPGEVRRNIFDCDDGLRLIVSVERTEALGTYLHLSASMQNECALAERLRPVRDRVGPKAAMEHFRHEAEERFAAISGDTAPLEFLRFTDHCVPHWCREMPAEHPQPEGSP